MTPNNAVNRGGRPPSSRLLPIAAAVLAALSCQAGIYDSWGYRMKISFTNPVSGTLTNFPVLVVLNTNALAPFAYGQFASPGNGADLRFSDASGAAALNFEIEKWNSNGSSYVWVQAPLLSGTGDCVYAYWGQPVGPAPCTTNGTVWTNGFEGVWHLGAPTSTQADSTTNANHALPHGNIATGSVGMVDGAVRLYSNGLTYLSVPHHPSIARTNDFTVECWFKMENLPASGKFEGFVSKSTSGYTAGWFLTCNSTPKYASYIPGAGGYVLFDGSANLGWHYLVMRMKGGVRNIFLDGVQQSLSYTGGKLTDSGTDLLFGRTSAGDTYDINGSLDEIRYSSVPRGSNWIYACWLNQNTNSALCRYGPVIPTAGPALAVIATGATQRGPTNAVLNGTLESAGGAENPRIYVCWGPEDAGTNALADWPRGEYLGTNWSEGQGFGTNVTGLLEGTLYTYRCCASNSTGQAWSAPATFSTIGFPAVTNLGAVQIELGTTRLQGRVTDTGGDTPSVWFACWPAGGGATNLYAAGPQNDACSLVVSNLAVGDYACRLMASNSAGVAWSAVVPFSIASSPFNGWTYSLRIAFTNPVGGTLTNFPALVLLGPDKAAGFDYRQFNAPANGADLRFSDSSRTRTLNYEIESWNTNGRSAVWVQVPLITGTNDCIYAFWGKPGCVESDATAGSVWSDGFNGVWHLGGTGATQADSTTNGNHAIPHGSVASNAAGMVNGAVHLDRAGAAYLNVPHNPSLALTNNFTVEAWFKFDSFPSDWGGIVGKSSSNNWPGWFMTYRSGPKYSQYDLARSNYLDCAGAATLGWHQMTFRMQDGLRSLFLDGAFSSSSGSGALTDAGTDLLFGRIAANDAGYYLNGTMDEIRYSAAPRSAAWIYACWLNQNTNTSLCAYGPVLLTLSNLTVYATGASPVGTTTAFLNGQLVHAGGGENPRLTIAWGPADAGTNALADWPHSEYLGSSWGEGQAFGTNVTGLMPGSNYMYRCHASNSTGQAWSDPVAFSPLRPPAVTNLGALLVDPWTATLRARIADDGGEAPRVWFHYRPAGSAATNTVDAGTRTGACSVTVTGLLPGSNYLYGVLASNNAGLAWSAELPFTMGRLSTQQQFMIVFDGNSWVYGAGSSGGSNFPHQTEVMLEADGRTATILNYGVSGQTILQMQSDAATQIDPNHTAYDTLVGLELVNQWGTSTSYTKEQIYDQYKQYFLDRKAAGFAYVYACTPHDQGYYTRTAGGDWATVRAYFIARMKDEFPGLGIGVIDCGSDPRLSAWTNTTYFSTDKIHLNNAGQEVQARSVYLELLKIRPPTAVNGGAVVLGLTSALLRGTITTGGDQAQARFQYWPVEGGATNVVDAGQPAGPCSVTLTDLAAGSYAYRLAASNSAGEAWSDVATFAVGPSPFADWAYSMKIAFTSAVPGSLVNFPVLVVLDASILPGFSHGQFTFPANGADLRFADESGLNALNYEIEKWDPAGRSVVWVQAPLINGTNSCIYAYWGRNAGAPPGTTNGAVWANGFRGVWHLNATNAVQPDSTTNRNDATASGGFVTGAAGRADGAVWLDGTNGFLNVPHHASLALTDNFTAEIWFKRDVYGNFDGFMSKLSDTFTKGWNLNFDKTSERYGAYIGGVNYQLADGSSVRNDSAWRHLALRIQSGVVAVFLDGVQQSVHSSVTVVDSGYPLVLGRFDVDHNDHFLQGLLDEARLSATPRGSNWIYACWLNQSAPTAFCGYGPVTRNPRRTGALIILR